MPPPPVLESSRSERGASDAAPAEDWLDIELDGDEEIGSDLMTTTPRAREPSCSYVPRSRRVGGAEQRRATSRSRRGTGLQSEDYARDHPEGATCCIPPGGREEHKRLSTARWTYARLCRQLDRVQVGHRRRRGSR